MKWFERQFEFDFGIDQGEIICHRLKHAPAKLQQAVAGLKEPILNAKPGGKWSIKEHIGHLCLLEKLWQERVNDFRSKKSVLTAADLENRPTFEANFNQYSISHLLDEFLKSRMGTMNMLDNQLLTNDTITIRHPRLNKPMRLIDHLYFMAEHDEHHLAEVRREN